MNASSFVPIPQEPTHDMMAAMLPSVRAMLECDTQRAAEVIRAVYSLAIETAPPTPGVHIEDKYHEILVIIDRVKTKTRKVPSHKQIADELGLPRPTVSYRMKWLVKMGYLRPAELHERVDGQKFSHKWSYDIAIRPDPYR